MTNPIKSLYKWMFNIDDRKTIAVPLQADITKENKALRQETASLKAQLGRMIAQKKEELDQAKEQEDEQAVAKELKQQERDILVNRFGQTVSLSKFFYQFATDKKFRNSIELTDKDDSEVKSKLGDIQVSENGWLVITDVHGNPMSYGPSLKSIVYKPETFGMQLKRGRLLLPFDKNYNSAYDIDELQINVPVYNENFGEEEGEPEFKFTNQLTVKATEIVKNKIREIREKNEYIERLETAQDTLLTELNDVKRTLKVLQTKDYMRETELTTAMANTMQFSSKIGDMNRKIATLTEIKAVYESKINVLENNIQRVLSKLEQADKTLYEQVKEEVKLDIEWAKTVVPETIQIKEEAPPHQPVIPNPGQTLGATGVIRK